MQKKRFMEEQSSGFCGKRSGVSRQAAIFAGRQKHGGPRMGQAQLDHCY